MPQSCPPFYFQPHRAPCRRRSKNSRSSLDVFHVAVGRKGRKRKRAGGVLSRTERHKGRNFQYKPQITEAPSQTLTIISTTSRLCSSDVLLGWTRQKSVLTAGGDGPEGKCSVPNFRVGKTGLKSLKPSWSSYLQYGLSVAKKDQSMFGKVKKRKPAFPV